jgi:hypothetical protein
MPTIILNYNEEIINFLDDVNYGMNHNLIILLQ